MSRREYADYLMDIHEAAVKGLSFIEGMSYDEFINDEKTIYAVIRALEVIGEATKRIPNDARAMYPDIEWQLMGRMRDKLIHNYFGVNLEVVWRTLQDDIPVLIANLNSPLNPDSIE
ncbi:MAG: DUF86 domain-containing protein [Candidatus Kapaibacterium sp.]